MRFPMPSHFLGIDVGTGSARAGVFDERGELLASAKHDIALFIEPGEIAEQSSRDIWQAVCASVREAVAKAGVDSRDIQGIGFDATCSLVVVGDDGEPLPVGRSGDSDRNIIVWMDHRALDQTRRINTLRHPVLDYVGGVISPEMETPKLLWLKENLPETFAKARHFFDLADYLTWRATGSLARSVCTLSCKWTYLSHERRWDGSYFQAVGLGELADEGFARIGTEVVDPGTAVGTGLTETAAAELGLVVGTTVASGLIDAHAGGVGTVGAAGAAGSISSRMAYVLGTSACTMASSEGPAFVPGVWGPYYSAMVPGLWLSEGGQSAAGAAIDLLVHFHPAAAEASARATAEGKSLVDWLAAAATAASPDLSAAATLAGSIHVVPEFLGNRSPLADPDARGLIAGLGTDRSVESLVGLYVAGLCGLGYGVRQIVAAMASSGLAVDTIVISGGAGQSALVRQLLADAAGLAVAASQSPEPVLLGAAMLGAVAAGRYADLSTAMPVMSRLGDVFTPATGDMRTWHDKRYEAFVALQAVGRVIR
ncbi:FGGY-family carbohydrate kinase [Mesorhizobium sp. VK25A]|uniref:FGGY-family carbohydrate kinase n=2 Tax=Mesorhizobium vachelliae TaxID=3072309 RepID=A0ABU5A011_9HYPH|nr:MULTISPECIES: FGGY-family carbohydrate kinase [unclassified Mesorhizobium]MDX8531018.1 FGGY-family carbohydrate kinase [Mesorhizobium sp. VK25D]MDX8543231.1 FGGY-family carbohydrate kinase [Mesorhizobium sp. VK25A]